MKNKERRTLGTAECRRSDRASYWDPPLDRPGCQQEIALLLFRG